MASMGPTPHYGPPEGERVGALVEVGVAGPGCPDCNYSRSWAAQAVRPGSKLNTQEDPGVSRVPLQPLPRLPWLPVLGGNENPKLTPGSKPLVCVALWAEEQEEGSPLLRLRFPGSGRET